MKTRFLVRASYWFLLENDKLCRKDIFVDFFDTKSKAVKEANRQKAIDAFENMILHGGSRDSVDIQVIQLKG